MSSRNSADDELELEGDTTLADESSFLLGGDNARKLGVWGLTVITFFNVSGGPIGFEDTVRWGGPFNVLVALLVIPMIFTLPMGLICAELASALPVDSGHTAWLQTAFGGKWGFYEGWLTWSAGSIDNSLYAGMIINIFHRTFPHAMPGLFSSASTILLIRLVISLALAVVPFLSVHWVSRFSAVSSVTVMFPVVLFVIVLLPQATPSNWLIGPPKPMDLETWYSFFMVMCWNMNGMDSMSTLAMRVQRPGRTFPLTISIIVPVVVALYVLVVLAATGVNTHLDMYYTGYFAHVAGQGGYWLAVLLVVSGIASCAGTYVSEMTSDSYMLAGMSDSKMVPALFNRRLKNETPINALLLRLLVILIAQPFNFTVLLHSHAILHALRMLLQCSSFVYLRRNRPDLNRPFKVPFGWVGAYVVPGSLATVSLLQILFAHWSAWLGAIFLMLFGVVLDRMTSQ